MIGIRIFNKPIRCVKEGITYNIQDKTLVINDNIKRELHLININSIKSIKIIAPKFKPAEWYNGNIICIVGETQ